jgi:hypothetical protein
VTFAHAPLRSLNTLALVEEGEGYWLFVSEEAMLTHSLEQ